MNRKYRKTIIAGNWKMNMLASSVKPFIEELKANMPRSKTCDVVLCTPAVMIPAMVKAGKVQEALNATNATRHDNAAKRKESLLGTNQFPNIKFFFYFSVFYPLKTNRFFCYFSFKFSQFLKDFSFIFYN